jgi:UDP-N-acetylglucosamine 2-epimerase
VCMREWKRVIEKEKKKKREREWQERYGKGESSERK